MVIRLAGEYLPLPTVVFKAKDFRSPKDFGQGLRIKVDLDAERGRQSKPGRENHHSVRIEKAKNDKIYLSVLRDYLDGKCDFNNGILEAISKLF